MDILNDYDVDVFEFLGIPDVGFDTHQIYAEVDKKFSELCNEYDEDNYSELNRRFNKYILSDEFETMVYSHFRPIEYLTKYTGIPYCELIEIPHIKETDPYYLEEMIEHYDGVLDENEFKEWLNHYFDDPPIRLD